MLLYLFVINLFFALCLNINETLIISLSTNQKNISNTLKVINSILLQNVDSSLYKIVLIVSNLDFYKMDMPNKLLSLEKENKIRIIFLKNRLNTQSKLVVAMKEFPYNPVLIINDNTLFPDGWLEMFLNDNKKYPNDAISASIQYFFGKNLNIMEFKEGYKGKKFGIFNHINNMIFNFAIINTNLGGTLYPRNFFKNNRFYDDDLFLNITNDNEEFWQSCFIMIENRTLRQTSKIFDYTKYIINDNINSYYNIQQKLIYEKNKISFLYYFPNFKQIVENRQQKVIVSFTSYSQRFKLLPLCIKSIKEQTFPLKTFLILSETDKSQYNLNISDINIIIVKENLKSHKKYFYTMQKFRDYAIITLDDDTYYARDTFENLYNSYLEYPNLVSGRRCHLMTYKQNKELKNYFEWNHKVTNIKEPNFDLFFTGKGGVLYPPDIFNINENSLIMINETFTGDDFTLKFFAIEKGISSKWAINNNINGLSVSMPKINSLSLFDYNKIINNKYIKNINIAINHTLLNNLCVSFKNIQTGLTIYLFNIHNIFNIKNSTKFDIYSLSYCPIDENINFNIYFNRSLAYCNIKNTKLNNFKISNLYIINVTCIINELISNFDNFYFPKVINYENDIHINICNIRKYLTIIFGDFHYRKLKAIFYQNASKGYKTFIKINNISFSCTLKNDVVLLNNNIPILETFFCKKLLNFNVKTNYVSGVPKYFWTQRRLKNNILNQFIILRIVKEFIDSKYFIIIIGKLFDNLKNDLHNILINIFYPNLILKCNLNLTSKNIQAYIYCLIEKEINSDIIIENQIIYSNNSEDNLLLINKETLIFKGEIIRYPQTNLENVKSYNFFDNNMLKFLTAFIFAKIIINIIKNNINLGKKRKRLFPIKKMKNHKNKKINFKKLKKF